MTANTKRRIIRPSSNTLQTAFAAMPSETFLQSIQIMLQHTGRHIKHRPIMSS
ncbi:Hypothetical protein NGK_1534 [Neisseria gonorrhoeae NCCP11945]|uniref:Uncharacterized protein n=1 Tax=Neisseria gonorrhoeae (strain NCCP11945) TaxID=521006 RepID=B4RN24_NEIG2|nr:Hypothetical protein NGK_1534 [Neisseria gonorrhoeae NCCP11945]